MRVYTEEEFEQIKKSVEMYVLSNSCLVPLLQELGTRRQVHTYCELDTREYGWKAFYDHYDLEDQKTPLTPEELRVVLKEKRTKEKNDG